MDARILREVELKQRERYSERLKKFGNDPRTLGWDSQESQRVRFARVLESVALEGRSLLDIGCGLADLLGFIREQGAELSAYTGWDINPDLIQACQERFPESAFEVRNLMLDAEAASPFDVVTMFGVLNFRFREFENETFARQMIGKAFALCNEALVVDMLSDLRDPSYPSEEFVYYYSPAAILEFAFSLTPHVTLRHDYASIPQREFTLILRKVPCGL